MERLIARTNDGSTLVCVATVVGGWVGRRYRLVGGDHDGREFASFGEVATFATVNGIQLTDTERAGV